MCELTRELYSRHQVNLDEIPYHLCIADYRSNFNTRHSLGRQHFGLYKISSETYCGVNGPGGLCEVKCGLLENEDISDDVKCAKIILHNHGISAWGLINRICDKYYEQMSRCLGRNANENYRNLETPEIELDK